MIAELANKSASVKEENSKLEQANDEISNMFKSLNEFALKKMEEKNKVAPLLHKLSKQQIPTGIKKISVATQEGNIEAKEKEVYRRYVYRIVHTLQTSDLYDHELYEEVMETVKACESELGNEALDFEESANLVGAFNESATWGLNSSFMNASAVFYD